MSDSGKPSLTEKLRALGVKVGAADLRPAPPAGEGRAPIESVVEGRFVSTRRGEVFVAEQSWGADYHHGAAPLAVSASLETVAAWMGEPRLASMPLEAMIFLDTETSGLAGGTGTYAFMVGVGRFEASGFRVSQFFMRDPSEEAALLEALAEYLASARALVTFNGKTFDAPLLMTRYRLHAIPLPFEDCVHLDLLPLARRLWRDRLPSRALKYLEENVLLAPRTSEEVPGYEIPYLYFDYLRTGDATPLKGVFYHNAMDIVALAALTGHVAAILHDPFVGHVQHGLDFIALAKLFEELGKWDPAARLYERGLEAGLPEADFWEAVRRLSRLERRRGDLEAAVHLWEQAAAQGHVYACVELAKHCEHRLHDPLAALAWTRRALECLSAANLPPYALAHWTEELEHRRRRLQAKAGRGA
ncbi:MAG: ribonuclease H-like domain-containing protein [Anaerolineales bacterium]